MTKENCTATTHSIETYQLVDAKNISCAACTRCVCVCVCALYTLFTYGLLFSIIIVSLDAFELWKFFFHQTNLESWFSKISTLELWPIAIGAWWIALLLTIKMNWIELNGIWICFSSFVFVRFSFSRCHFSNQIQPMRIANTLMCSPRHPIPMFIGRRMTVWLITMIHAETLL